jgi:hypothetical protein
MANRRDGSREKLKLATLGAIFAGVSIPWLVTGWPSAFDRFPALPPIFLIASITCFVMFLRRFARDRLRSE